jgi:hypothetical protein
METHGPEMSDRKDHTGYIASVYWFIRDTIADANGLVDQQNADHAEPEGDPVGDPVGDPEGDPVGDPEGDPVGDPEGDPVGDPEGDPVGDPEGDPEGDPVGEPNGKPDDEPDDDPDGEPDDEPVGDPDDDPDGEPDEEPNDQPNAGPDGQPGLNIARSLPEIMEVLSSLCHSCGIDTALDVVKDTGLYNFLVDLYFRVHHGDTCLLTKSFLRDDFRKYLLNNRDGDESSILVDIWYENAYDAFFNLIRELSIDVFTTLVKPDSTPDTICNTILWVYMVMSGYWDQRAVNCLHYSVILAFRNNTMPSLLLNIRDWIYNVDPGVVNALPRILTAYLFGLWNRLGRRWTPTMGMVYEKICSIVNCSSVLPILLSQIANDTKSPDSMVNHMACLTVPCDHLNTSDIRVGNVGRFYMVMFKNIYKEVKKMMDKLIPSNVADEVSLIVLGFLGIVPNVGNLKRILFFRSCDNKNSIEFLGDEKIQRSSNKREIDTSSSSNQTLDRRVCNKSRKSVIVASSSSELKMAIISEEKRDDDEKNPDPSRKRRNDDFSLPNPKRERRDDDEKNPDPSRKRRNDDFSSSNPKRARR